MIQMNHHRHTEVAIDFVTFRISRWFQILAAWNPKFSHCWTELGLGLTNQAARKFRISRDNHWELPSRNPLCQSGLPHVYLLMLYYHIWFYLYGSTDLTHDCRCISFCYFSFLNLLEQFPTSHTLHDKKETWSIPILIFKYIQNFNNLY